MNLDVVSKDTYRTKDSKGLKIKELLDSNVVKMMTTEINTEKLMNTDIIITVTQEDDVDGALMSASKDTNIPKITNSDFTPYNSTKQNLLWKNWGKDIDWGKVKFQGSDIYTKAQHLGGNEGKEGYQTPFEVIKKDEKEFHDGLNSSVIDNNLKSSENNLIGNFDKKESKLGKMIEKKKFTILKPVSVRAAYNMAVPQEKDTKKSTISKDEQTIINAVMMVKNINKESIIKKDNQKIKNSNFFDEIKPKVVQKYEEKTQKGPKKDQFINAAEVLVPNKNKLLERTLSLSNITNSSYAYAFDDNYDSSKDSVSKEIENKEHRIWVETVMHKARIIDYESKHKLRV
jgi:hypothetical protein